MAHLDAAEANLLALPLALGLINDTSPAPQVGDTIINIKLLHTGTPKEVEATFVGAIARIGNLSGAWTKDGNYLGRINKGGWETYVTKHAEPHSLATDSTIIPASAS